MFDNVTITYRGSGYEIGRGSDFYGIWTVGAPRSRPLERWPETPDGWSAAWARFTEIEAPGTIAPAGRRIAWPGQRMVPAGQRTVPAGQRAAGAGTRIGAIFAAVLLAAGVILGIASLFPAYLDGQSLAQQPANLVPHVIYLAAWSLSAGLILLGGARLRMGALLGAGLSVVTFGLFFADAATAIAGGSQAGAGLVLGLLGWLACAAGSVVAFRLRPAGTSGRPGALGRRLRGSDAGPLGLLVLAGLGTAVAFAPSWDSYVLRTASGETQSLTAGNAFANPGLVIAGDVAVMVAVAVVVIAAALWRPMRHGAALLAGAIIPMAAQAISALIQVGEPVSPSQLGISPAQASQLGLTISSGLTPVFWVYCVFVVALMVSCAWMFFTPHDAAGLLPDPAGAGPGPDTEADVWHVARADTYDVTGVRSPVSAAAESAAAESAAADFDDEFNDDDFDGYDELDGHDPADDATTPGLGPAATHSAAAPGDESASRD